MIPKTILLLEDSPESLSVLREVLNQAGFRVLEAGDSEEAVELCKRHRRDLSLMISDVVLTGVTGPATAERIKLYCPDLPILYISGHGRDELLNRGLLDREETAWGSVRFLQKPFTTGELRNRVNAILNSSGSTSR